MTRRRLFNIATLLSLLICVSMAPVWIVSEQISSIPSRDGWHLTSSVRVELVDGWIAFFNQSMPFFNGTVGMSAMGKQPVWPRAISLRFPGFHFVHFKWPGQFPGGTYWTFAISPAYPMLLTAILPAIWLTKFSRRRRAAIGHSCPTCSYNLTGNLSGVCPECGVSIERKTDIPSLPSAPG